MKGSRLLSAVVVSIWLVVGAASGSQPAAAAEAADQQQQQDNGEQTKPNNPFGSMTHQKYGPIKLAISESPVKTNEKLVVNKKVSNYFLVIEDQTPNRYVPLFKATSQEELVPCDGQLPIRPEILPYIDCKPLVDHYLPNLNKSKMPELLSDLEKQTWSNKQFVVQTKTRTKSKLDLSIIQIPLAKSKSLLSYFPLKRDYVDLTVSRVLKEHNFHSGFLKFAETYEGYHLITRADGDVICDMNLIYDTYYAENGLFVTLQEVSCRHPNNLIMPISIEGDFTFIAQNDEFPYLTCSNHIKSSPLSVLFDYEGFIKQTRDETASPDAYNTSIKVTARSALVDALNLNLEQIFVNTNRSTGFEEMILVHPFASALVQAEWTPDSLVKSMKCFLSADKHNLSLGSTDKGAQMKPEVSVAFENKPDKEYAELIVRVPRKWMNWTNQTVEQPKASDKRDEKRIEL
jgi:hypothetical protein